MNQSTEVYTYRGGKKLKLRKRDDQFVIRRLPGELPSKMSDVALEAPEVALNLRPTEPAALLTVDEEMLNRAAGQEVSEAANVSQQAPSDKSKTTQGIVDRLGAWAELALKAAVEKLPPAFRIEFPDAHSAVIIGLAVSADGSIVATGSNDHTVRIWSVPGLQPVRTIYLPVGRGNQGAAYTVAFSPDAQSLVARRQLPSACNESRERTASLSH